MPPLFLKVTDILYPFWSTLSIATARNIIYLSHHEIYLSHPQFISVTCVTEKNWKQMKFILITFKFSQSSSTYLSHLQIYLSHPQFISVIPNLSQSPSNISQSFSIYLSHPQFISIILTLSQSSSIYLSHVHQKPWSGLKVLIRIINWYKLISKWFQNAHTRS